MKKRFTAGLMAMVFAVLIIGCDKTDDKIKNTNESASKTLQSIAVTPANPSVDVGSTKQFTATGTYSDATTKDLSASVTWTSETLTVATIDANGLSIGISAGTTKIKATSGTISGDTTLTVTTPGTTAAELQSIAVTPATPSVDVGSTKQFTATGTYSDSTTKDLTTTVTWTSGTSTVATVDANGLAVGVSAGATKITATSGTISGDTTLTVTTPGTATTGTSPTITSFTPTSGAVGTAVEITGTNFGNPMSLPTVKFNGTTAPTITGISSKGLYVKALVPAGATTGVITVTTGGGTATSTTDFNVITVQNTCNSLVPTGELVSQVGLTTAAPILNGGTIADGTYLLTKWEKFGENTAGATGLKGKDIFVFSGNKAERFFDISGIATTTVFQSFGPITTNGNQLAMTVSCSKTAAEVGTTGSGTFEVSGDTFKYLASKDDMYTYVRQQ